MGNLYKIPEFCDFKIRDEFDIDLQVFKQIYNLSFDDKYKFESAKRVFSKNEFKLEDLNDELRDFLDSECLLVEDKKEDNPEVFYSYLFNYINNDIVIERGQSELSSRLLEPRENRNLLVGWTLEYYQVTKQAVACLAPILMHNLRGDVMRLATDFIKEELFHEKIMEKGLRDSGLTQSELRNTVPLPSTVAYMDHLRDMAMHRPDSFFASLVFYEGDDNDLSTLAESIPNEEGFSCIRAAQISHAHINESGSHSNFSKQYFSLVDELSKERQQAIVDDAKYFMDLYYDHQKHVLDYYSVNDVSARLKG